MRSNQRILGLLVLLAAGAFLRLIPHPWNFTPIGAMALLGGAALRGRPLLAFLLPLGSLLAGDILLEVFTGYGFHAGMPVVYASFAFTVVIGIVVGSRRSTAPAIAGGAIASAVLFYLTTNYWMWTVSVMYPPTAAGLVACYVAGLPFLGNQVAGDLLYSGVFFGAHAWMQRRVATAGPGVP